MKIELKNLNFSYSKEDHAIRDLNLTIEEKKWISIIGHNGSGKSTLAKLLIGLLQADSGQILLDGVELNEHTVNQFRQKIGIIFQNPDNQFVGVTVKHDIAFGLENRNIDRKKMIELVNTYSKKVDMYNYLENEPSLLSGGQKQRVAIASVLACNPDIIIFDEATSMLDPQGKNSIIDLIKELKNDNNKTLITITHDLNLARLSDQIICMNKGKVVLNGTPKEIFEHEEILKESNVNIPFDLQFLNKCLNDDKLKENEKLIGALWELNLTK
jgi:energy-coupling factor transport system ATP-binding protein